MFDYKFIINPDDTIYSPGVDFGGNLFLIDCNSRYLLIFKTGKTEHLQRGDYIYSRPTYYVYKFTGIEIKEGRRIIHCENKKEFEYNRQNKKEVYKQALEYFRGD